MLCVKVRHGRRGESSSELWNVLFVKGERDIRMLIGFHISGSGKQVSFMMKLEFCDEAGY